MDLLLFKLKTNIRELWTHILRTVMFSCILLILLAALSCLFVPKNNGEENGIQNARLYGFLAEPPESMDVVFIGDSLAACAVSPLDIWNTCGITAYNCGTGSQQLNQTQEYLEVFFEKQHPKMVFMDAHLFYTDCPREDILVQQLEKRFPVFRHHDLWKLDDFSQLFSKTEYTHLHPTKGYRSVLEVNPAKQEALDNYMKPWKSVDVISKGNQSLILKIKEFCQANQSELVIFSTPSVISWCNQMHNGTEQFCEENGLTFFDFNLKADEIPIDWSRDTYDGGDHLNYNGTVKLTAWFEKYLMETGTFTDKRMVGDYRHWNNAYIEFIENLQTVKE